MQDECIEEWGTFWSKRKADRYGCWEIPSINRFFFDPQA
jgi:hypothetical protein